MTNTIIVYYYYYPEPTARSAEAPFRPFGLKLPIPAKFKIVSKGS
jgi:hypothetical protein